MLQSPRTGIFKSDPTSYLYFYDGAEGMRDLAEHGKSVKRLRGYSCEELGGAAYRTAEAFSRIERLSKTLHFFISHHGTCCSRYTTALQAEEGVYTCW